MKLPGFITRIIDFIKGPPETMYSPVIRFYPTGTIEIDKCLGPKLTIKFKRGMERQLPDIIPSEHELIYVMDKKEYRIGDGKTPGGLPFPFPKVGDADAEH